MKVLHLKINEQLNIKASCAAFGFFDGMHLGHLELIKKVSQLADEKHLKKALVTLSNHPKAVIKNEQLKYLTSLEDKINLLKEYHFDYLIVIDFNLAVASLLPLDFINQYIIKQKIKYVVCGFDYHFGYLGKGNAETLKANAQEDYKVVVVNKKENHGVKVASSSIIDLLEAGDMNLVNKLLNRQYQITGKVIYGKQIGSTKLGFPTANIEYNDYALPKVGVYGVKVLVENKLYLGMASVGYNPTVETLNKQSLEVNIFNFNQDIYGKTIAILFYFYIRAEIKFSGFEALIDALNNDKRKVEEYFKA